jgi:hypothetical protein
MKKHRQSLVVLVLALSLVVAALTGCAKGAATGTPAGQTTGVGQASATPPVTRSQTETAAGVFSGYLQPGAASDLAFIEVGGSKFVGHAGDFRDLGGGESVVVQRDGPSSAWTIVEVRP